MEEINITGEITPDTYINVIAQARSISGNEVTVNIDSPGGNEAISDKIASFLDTLGKKITTVQTGIVASAAVKIFLKGSVRKANANYPFLIHNTHIDPQDIPVNLDANNSQALATMLQESRTSLASFYAKATGNNEQAIIAVMDQDQPMNASQALALGFATEITNEIPILAKINMSKIQEFIDKIKANIAPVAPPAPAAPIVAKTYKVGDPAGDLQEGENQQPDGSIVVVMNGVVSEIKPATPAPTMAQVQSLEGSVTALAEQVANLSEMVKAKLESEKEITKSITEIKDQIKGKHTPPLKKENQNQPLNNELAKKFDEMFVAGTLGQVKAQAPEDYKNMYFAKYGVNPNI